MIVTLAFNALFFQNFLRNTKNPLGFLQNCYFLNLTNLVVSKCKFLFGRAKVTKNYGKEMKKKKIDNHLRTKYLCKMYENFKFLLNQNFLRVCRKLKCMSVCMRLCKIYKFNSFGDKICST